jgi:hypothetical protein
LRQARQRLPRDRDRTVHGRAELGRVVIPVRTDAAAGMLALPSEAEIGRPNGISAKGQKRTSDTIPNHGIAQ